MTQATGYVVNVLAVESGSEVEDDVALGATSIVVADSFAFNEDGGQFTIDDGSTVYGYDKSDPYTETLYLSAPLGVSIAANTPIKVYPAGIQKVAMVQLDDDNEGVRAVIPFSMADRFVDGIRDAQDMESVHISDQNGRWEIIAVEEQPVRINGAAIDPTGLPPSVPTVPPAVSPDPTVIAGSGAAVVRWPYVADASSYDIHVSTTNSSPPDADTLYMSDVNSPMFVNFLDIADRTPIPTDVDTYFAIVARNAVGPAAPSAWVAGRAGLIDDSVLAVSLAVIQNVVAELVQTQGLVIGGQTWNSDSGLTIPGVLNFPPNDATAASIWATMVARALTVQNNLLLQGLENEMSYGAALELAAGVTNPKIKPTNEFVWPSQPIYGTSAHPEINAIACDDGYAGPGLRMAILKPDGTRIQEVVNGALTGVQSPDMTFTNQRFYGIARGTGLWYVLAKSTDSPGFYSIWVFNDDFTEKGYYSIMAGTGITTPVKIAVEPESSAGFDKVHMVWGEQSGSTHRLKRREIPYERATSTAYLTSTAKNMDSITSSSPVQVNALLFATIGGSRVLYVGQTVSGNPSNVKYTLVAGSGADTRATGTGNAFAPAGFEFSSRSLTLAAASDPDGSFCYGLDSAGYLRKYSKHVGAWGSHTTWYTWYDDDPTGGTHESQASPAATVDAGYDYGRAFLKVTPPPVSTPILSNTPNKHRIYAATTSGGTKRLQGPTVSGTLTLSDLDTVSATTPPGSNGFIGAGVDAALLKSEATDSLGSMWWFKGDGAARIPSQGTMREVSRSAAQSIANNATPETIVWNQSDYTKGSDLPMTGGVATVGKAGRYVVTAWVQWASNATGRRRVQIVKNSDIQVIADTNAVSGATTSQSISTVMYCAVNDTIDVRASQNSGGALDVNTGSRMKIAFMGE